METTLLDYKVENVVSTLNAQRMGWQIKQLLTPDTWLKTKGCDVRVMVIDSGCSNHSDLIDGINRHECRSFLRSEIDIIDRNGHGTHCLGIIGARDNAFGVVGVAPNCRLISCKTLGQNGRGDLTAIHNALRYAKFIKPNVINMSLGTYDYDPIMHQLVKELTDMNIPIIAAAGNDGRRNAVNYPAKYPETICVTAYDKRGRPARFNSTGKTVDFSAPGVKIYSTWLNNSYSNLDGTSMATPVITGIVALLLAKHHQQEIETGKNDCRTVEEIREHLKNYASNNGEICWDENWGYGVIDVDEAIKNF